MADHVFPEDSGTGAAEGDYDDAANFASLAQATGLTDYVVQGLNFTLNASTPSLDISKGKAVVTQSQATSSQSAETRDGVAFVAEMDARTGISLTDGDVNHVFLQVDLSSDDTINIVVNTTNSAPAQPYVKLGTVDTSTDTTTELNRGTPIEADTLRGNNGSSGQVLQTDGSNTSWEDLGGGETVKTVSSDYTTSGETSIIVSQNEFDITSSDLSSSNPSDQVRAVAPDSNRNIIYGEASGTIRKIDSSGTNVWNFNGHSDQIRATKLGPDEEYLYTASDDNTVKKIDLSVLDAGGTDSEATIWTFSQHVNSVEDLAVDSNYNIYSIGFDDTVRKIDLSGSQVWSISTSVRSKCIDIGENEDYIYYGDTDSNIIKIDASGTEIWSYSVGTSQLIDVTVDSQGFIYGSTSSGILEKIDADKNLEWEYDSGGSNFEVAVSNLGNSYLGRGNGTFEKIDSTGTKQDSFTVNDDYVLSVEIREGNLAVGTTYSNFYVYRFDNPSPNITLSSSDASSGKIVRVKDAKGTSGNNSVTVDTESSETIDGSSSITLNTDYAVKQLQSDGSNWYIISDG